MEDGKVMNKLNVLYEDNHIIVVEKEANVLSQGDSTGDVSIMDMVKTYIKEKYHKSLIIMENKIQELTDKIYREGVEKGNEEAQRLVGNAREEAAKILEDARKEADAIIAAARKTAAETAENTQSEIKLFAGQAVNALKTEVASLLTNQVVTEAVKGFVSDKDYLNKFIVSLATQWVADEAIVISTADAEGLKKYFAANAKAVLDKGVKIEQVNGNKTLFSISPADGSYKVNFGEEEFENYFKDFLRPQLVEMLF